MDKDEALSQVNGIAFGYFYDSPIGLHDDEILAQMVENIHGSGPDAIGIWQKISDAFKYQLDNMMDDQLDELLIHSFNRSPPTVGGGRVFISKIHSIINDAIKK
jgi:hypothetical protein